MVRARGATTQARQTLPNIEQTFAATTGLSSKMLLQPSSMFWLSIILRQFVTVKPNPLASSFICFILIIVAIILFVLIYGRRTTLTASSQTSTNHRLILIFLFSTRPFFLSRLLRPGPKPRLAKISFTTILIYSGSEVNNTLKSCPLSNTFSELSGDIDQA